MEIRHDLRPGDLGRVTALHGVLYAGEHGFDIRFEAYVAGSLAEMAEAGRPDRDRLWLAEDGGRLAGCIGMLGREGGQWQLRWFLVAPEARGRGLGSRLLDLALGHAGTASVHLWTVDPLVDAARLYGGRGFRLTEETPAKPLWGKTLREQRYDRRG